MPHCHLRYCRKLQCKQVHHFKWVSTTSLLLKSFSQLDSNRYSFQIWKYSRRYKPGRCKVTNALTWSKVSKTYSTATLNESCPQWTSILETVKMCFQIPEYFSKTESYEVDILFLKTASCSCLTCLLVDCKDLRSITIIFQVKWITLFGESSLLIRSLMKFCSLKNTIESWGRNSLFSNSQTWSREDFQLGCGTISSKMGDMR